jgi:hypothetical protein
MPHSIGEKEEVIKLVGQRIIYLSPVLCNVLYSIMLLMLKNKAICNFSCYYILVNHFLFFVSFFKFISIFCSVIFHEAIYVHLGIFVSFFFFCQNEPAS